MARLRAHYRMTRKASDEWRESNFENRDALMKLVFNGVKAMILEPKAKEYSELQGQFRRFDALMTFMGDLTPREFTRIFPIEKTYDGKRWGTKDYFYVIEEIDKKGWDKPIGDTEAVAEFLWDFDNRDIRKFFVRKMCILSDLRRCQGEPGLMEEWAAKNNLTLYRHHKDQNGKEFLTDGSGNVIPVSKPKKRIPKHWKVIDNT